MSNEEVASTRLLPAHEPPPDCRAFGVPTSVGICGTMADQSPESFRGTPNRFMVSIRNRPVVDSLLCQPVQSLTIQAVLPSIWRNAFDQDIDARIDTLHPFDIDAMLAPHRSAAQPLSSRRTTTVAHKRFATPSASPKCIPHCHIHVCNAGDSFLFQHLPISMGRRMNRVGGLVLGWVECRKAATECGLN